MLSRFKALKRNTKITLTGAVAVALIAAGVGVWLLNTEDPRPASRVSQGPETTYQHIAALCDEIDMSLAEEEFGAMGEIKEVENKSDNGSVGIHSCIYPFGDDAPISAGAYVNAKVSVQPSEKQSIDDGKSIAEAYDLTTSDDRFFEHWDYSRIKGSSTVQPTGKDNDADLEHLVLVVQKGNLVIELTVNDWKHSELDTDTPLDEDALAMQIAVSITDQIEELTHK